MLWLKLAFVVMIAVGTFESFLVGANRAWWCKDNRIRRGGYTDDRYYPSDKRY